MKKLLIAMTAAAVGFGAWADENAPTLLNENFDAWTNGTDLEYMTVLPVGLWSYSAELGEGELKVVADGEGDNALSLNTGSKVLKAKFADNAVDMAVAPYFNATVTFKDPSDTLPELGEQDKFALVVLDNVESVETYSTEADPIANTTNLWLIAKYGATDKVKRAFKLNIPVTGTKPEQDENGGDVLTNLDKTWLDAPHEIVIKAYSNVMSDSQKARAGFLVMVDGYICKVDYSCEIDNSNVINPSTAVYAGQQYLGFDFTAINDTLRPRYTKNQLLLSMTDDNDTLASVDFQGQGVIDNVSLAKTGADFGADANVLTFEGYDSNEIESITVAGNTVANGAYVILGTESKDDANKSTIVVTVREGYVLDMEGWSQNGRVYTYLYELLNTSAKLTLNVYKPAAYVNGKAYATVQAALTYIAENGGTGTVVLNDNVSLTDDDIDSNGLTISSGEITIDLNGNTIVAEECNTIGVTGGKLIVKDEKGGGAILAAEGYFAIDASAGLTEIKAGTIGLINNDNAKNLKLVGGSYTDATVKVDDEDTFAYAGSVADGFGATLTDGVWVVAAGSSYTESEKLVEGEMTEAATETLDAIAEAIGESAGDDDVATYIANAYGTDKDGQPIKVSVATLAGAVNVAVSVQNNLPLMTSEDAEFVAEAVAADEGNVAAFEFKLVDGQDAEGKDNVLPVSVKAKLENLIKVCTDLNTTWKNATIEAEGVENADVKATVSNGKVKVQLKSNEGGKCFMKLQATATR